MAYSSRNQHPAQERRHDGQAEISAHPSKGFFFFFPPVLLITVFIKKQKGVFLWYSLKACFYGIIFNVLLTKDRESLR